jgi:hypothetical protein
MRPQPSVQGDLVQDNSSSNCGNTTNNNTYITNQFFSGGPPAAVGQQPAPPPAEAAQQPVPPVNLEEIADKVADKVAEKVAVKVNAEIHQAAEMSLAATAELFSTATETPRKKPPRLQRTPGTGKKLADETPQRKPAPRTPRAEAVGDEVGSRRYQTRSATNQQKPPSKGSRR